MPRQCSICSQPSKTEINRLLISGEPLVSIVSKFPELTKSSLNGHLNSHIPQSMAQAKNAQDVAQADDILGRLQALSAETRQIFQELKQAKDFDLALKAINRLERQEAEARLQAVVDVRDRLQAQLDALLQAQAAAQQESQQQANLRQLKTTERKILKNLPKAQGELEKLSLHNELATVRNELTQIKEDF